MKSYTNNQLKKKLKNKGIKLTNKKICLINTATIK